MSERSFRIEGTREKRVKEWVVMYVHADSFDDARDKFYSDDYYDIDINDEDTLEVYDTEVEEVMCYECDCYEGDCECDSGDDYDEDDADGENPYADTPGSLSPAQLQVGEAYEVADQWTKHTYGVDIPGPFILVSIEDGDGERMMKWRSVATGCVSSYFVNGQCRFTPVTLTATEQATANERAAEADAEDAEVEAGREARRTRVAEMRSVEHLLAPAGGRDILR